MDKIIGTGVFLFLCLVTNSRKRLVWPVLCLLLIVAASFEPGKDYGLSLLSAMIGFVPLLIATGSWEEALLPSTLGYVLSFRLSLYLYLAASLFYVIILSAVAMRKKDRDRELPYAPFVCAGWVTVLILNLTGLFCP